MKTFALLASLILAATSASADLYLRGSALYANTDSLTTAGSFSAAVDNSVGFTAALGYQFAIVRVEGEGIWLESDIDGVSGPAETASGNLDHVDLFVNAYVDIPGIPFITPYVGVGAGIGFVDLEGDVVISAVDSNDLDYSKSESLFGYQFIVGVRANIPATDISIYANYRYISFENFEAASEQAGAPILEMGDVSAIEIGAMIWF